jgi:hypothetical protein
VGLEEDLARIRAAASRHAAPGETLEGVVPAEPSGTRVYLCAYVDGEERTWLALDDGGRPVQDRALVRDAVSIAALCELAEQSAGGGNIGELRARLVELRLSESPEGIEEAEAAAQELQETIVPPPRVASAAYLDAVGAAAARLERSLGEVSASPFAAAMKNGLAAAEDLATEVLRRYKTVNG